MIMKF
jgi:drug/metabolite transporter (DMT)-like permease